MPELSRTARAASQAMSIKFNNLVYEMRARGEEVIVLSLGEAFFDIPLRPFDDLPFPALYHYSHSRGVPELRREVAAYYRNSFGAAVDPERELIITAGSKAAIYFSLLATVDPGDEVLLREPTWVSYPEQVKLCGGVPVFAPHEAGLDDLERYLTPKSKVIILNNPNNPRGEVAAEEQLRRLLELARKRDLFLLFDEAYSDFVLDGSFRSGAAL